MSDVLGPAAYHNPFTKYTLYRVERGFLLKGSDPIRKEFAILRITNSADGGVELSTGDIRYRNESIKEYHRAKLKNDRFI